MSVVGLRVEGMRVVQRDSPKHVKVQANPGLDVKENVSLTLSCSAESNPPVSSVTWRKTTDGREEIVQQNQTQTFRVNSASPSDSGLYSCEATNDIGREKSQPAEVEVRYPPTEPKLSMSSEVTEGQNITINCTVESFPQSTLTLMKTNTNHQSLKITENNLYSRHINSLSNTFTVTSANAGWYFCRAENTEGYKDSEQKELVVKYSPKHVTVQANPGLDVKENVSLTLSCSAESNPPVSSVTWRKTTDGREEIIQQTQTQTFRVNSASPSDSGLYSCEATNDIGSGKSQPAEVKVIYSPNNVKVRANPGLDVKEKVSLTLSCSAESYPPVSSVTWMKTTDGREEIIQQTWRKTFRVNSASPSDSGLYSCEATNDIGSEKSQTAEVKVRYKPRKTTISVSGSSDNQVKVGRYLTLTCDTDANPAPTTYSWYRSKNQQTDSWWKTTNSRELSLTIQRADEACYRCSASNLVGEGDESQPVCIKVLYPPTEPILSMRSEVTEDETITISCTVESFPESTLTLMRTNTYHQTLKINENNLYSRAINTLSHTFTVTSDDTGWYVCRAQNTEGSKDSKKKELVVKYSPKHVTVQANPGLDVKENVLLTLSCSADSNPPVSSVTWRKTTDGREEIIQQTQTQTFRVNSASPSDSGLYSCEATNDIGSGKSQPAEVKVRFAPKHTNITESAEKQELDGRSSVMLSCFSHSFPTVQHYSWYRKSQGEEKDEIVSKHQNHTVYSNQSGVYYCIAENEIDQRSSDPVHLFERNSLDILMFIVPALFVLMIIILIIVVLRYRRKKSIQQGTTNTESPTGFSGRCNGPRRRSLTYENVSVEPFRSRDDLFSEQLRRPEAPALQPLPDSTPPTDINAVYSILSLPQAASAQNPTRQKAGNTKDDSANYASVDFKNKLKKVEEDPVYAKVSKPTRVKKNEPESLQDYENISNATARAPKYPNLFDNHTSEGEVELNYSQVRFTAKPRRQTTNRDSSSSEEDESLYSNVRI
ncbi:B-cell receptor CD22-like [Limanda limanda]|uniref:B-cell receptor CD22-like n=1 Tax=Limanda limanda TaxID=27771 RepID=UPI0029C82BC3|nr:B-cell receptor CD22-like [Limanda limanda]